MLRRLLSLSSAPAHRSQQRNGELSMAIHQSSKTQQNSNRRNESALLATYLEHWRVRNAKREGESIPRVQLRERTEEFVRGNKFVSTGRQQCRPTTSQNIADHNVSSIS